MMQRHDATPGLAVVAEAEPTDTRRRVEMTPDKVQLLKDTICQGADDNELALAMALVERLQLDPFARQIAFIKRWNGDLRREVMTPQITIDGARLLAERTRKYGGQLGPWWCGEDGVWQDIWLKKTPPAAARVGVIRVDWREPLYAVARFDAYAARKKDGELTMMWAKMPDILIAKCAEMLALRRAFPAELSGVYSDDEMAQAGNAVPAPAEPIKTTAQLSQPSEPTPIKTTAQLMDGAQGKEEAPAPLKVAKQRLWSEAKRRGMSKDLLNDYALEQMGVDLEELAIGAVEDLCQRLKAERDNDGLLDRLSNAPNDDGEFVDVEMFDTNSPDRFTR